MTWTFNVTAEDENALGGQWITGNPAKECRTQLHVAVHGELSHFKFVACGKVNVAAPETRARPKSSMARWPTAWTVSGSIKRFTARPLTLPLRFCHSPLPAPLFFTDATVTSILGGPGFRRKVSALTRATISLTRRNSPSL